MASPTYHRRDDCGYDVIVDGVRVGMAVEGLDAWQFWVVADRPLAHYRLLGMGPTRAAAVAEGMANV